MSPQRKIRSSAMFCPDQRFTKNGEQDKKLLRSIGIGKMGSCILKH